MRLRECCGSGVIINTFKRMSFCAQFIIIPKRAQHHLFRLPTRVHFHLLSFSLFASQTEGTERVGMIFATSDASRVFIYHCSTLYWTGRCVVSSVRLALASIPLPHCLFQFTPKPMPSLWNPAKRFHNQTIVPPLPTDSAANHGLGRRGARSHEILQVSLSVK